MHLSPFFALAARVQKTLPGLVPSEMETTMSAMAMATQTEMAGWDNRLGHRLNSWRAHFVRSPA